MILVDSNVIVYAINSDSPKQALAQSFLQAKATTGELAVAHQNIMESLRVLTHSKFPSPMSTKAAIAAVNVITKSCRIIVPTRDTYYLATNLISKYHVTGDKLFDIYLAATALSAGISEIATDNAKDFKQIAEVSIVNPFSKQSDL